MKKFFVAIAIVAVAVTPVIAGVVMNNSSETHADMCDHVSVTSSGACSHPGCKCTSFNQRPGYYSCWCGHQRFSHTK